MNSIIKVMNEVKNKQYNDARNDMLKALHLLSGLYYMQKKNTISELLGVEVACVFYSLSRKYLAIL